MNHVLALESNKYEIKLDKFEGPLDVLCYLISKNKMDITDVNISAITDQYIALIQQHEQQNLEVASEFLIMASNLILLKSKSLLPKQEEDEGELTEEELRSKIIAYKKYKEMSQIFREQYDIYKKRIFKNPEPIILKKQELEEIYEPHTIPDKYAKLIHIQAQRKNDNAKNIEKIAVTETVSVASKVKEIFRELVRHSKFVFSHLFSKEKCSKMEIITAFSGVLELNRKNKIQVKQDTLFGDIYIEKAPKKV